VRRVDRYDDVFAADQVLHGFRLLDVLREVLRLGNIVLSEIEKVLATFACHPGFGRPLRGVAISFAEKQSTVLVEDDVSHPCTSLNSLFSCRSFTFTLVLLS